MNTSSLQILKNKFNDFLKHPMAEAFLDCPPQPEDIDEQFLQDFPDEIYGLSEIKEKIYEDKYKTMQEFITDVNVLIKWVLTMYPDSFYSICITEFSSQFHKLLREINTLLPMGYAKEIVRLHKKMRNLLTSNPFEPITLLPDSVSVVDLMGLPSQKELYQVIRDTSLLDTEQYRKLKMIISQTQPVLIFNNTKTIDITKLKPLTFRNVQAFLSSVAQLSN